LRRTEQKSGQCCEGYLPPLKGNVVPLSSSVWAVLEVLQVSGENSGHGVLIGRRFVTLSSAKDHIQPIEDSPDMIDHVSPKSCSV
jgi:hypothetical protein